MTALALHRGAFAQRNQAIWIYAALIACVLFLGLCFLVAGFEVFSMALAAGLAVLLFLYPRQGLYGVISVFCMVEGSSGFVFLRDLTVLYESLSGLFHIHGFPISTLDVALGIILLSVFSRRKAAGMQAGELFWPWALLCLAILPGILRGFYAGGDYNVAVQEVRSLFYVPVIYLAAINLLKERRHVHEFTAVLVGAITVMSLSALWVQFTVIRPGHLRTSVDVEFLSHENALFAAMVVLLAAGTIIWGKGSRLRLLMLIPGAISLGGLLVLKRRVGLVALDVGLVLMTLAFIKQKWRLAIIVMPIVLIVGGGYIGATWNANGSLGQPARAVRAIMGDNSDSEDVSSNTYREAEAFNVEWNIRENPILGSGFGKEYVFVRPVPDLTGFWSFQHFTPHNSVLAIWMNGGIVPFVLLLGAFGHAMMKGMATARREVEPLLRAWGLVAACTIPMVFLFGWEDLGLNSARTLSVLAVALAMITVVGTVGQSEGPKTVAPVPALLKRGAP
jgi:hypothetical protein